MSLPRTPVDRRARSGKAAANGRKSRRVEQPAPDIFVAVKSDYIPKYAKARIRIRKGCYQYLVWRDGEETREFYLGKRENHTPRTSSPAPAIDVGRGSSSSRILRGKK